MSWSDGNRLLRKLVPNTGTDRLTLNAQIGVFRTVSDFLKNGFPLSEALDFYVTVNSRDVSSVKIIRQIRLKLMNGISFSDSVGSFIGSDLYYQIAIAEQHGNLVAALDEIGRFLQIKSRQRSKLLNLLVYPAFLLVLLTIMIVAIHVFITPQLRASGGSVNGSSLWRWFFIFLGITVIFLTVIAVKKYHTLGQLQKVNLALKIPFLNQICRCYYAYYFASNLSMMVQCGMNIQQIIQFMCNVRGSQLLSHLGYDIKAMINRGQDEKQLVTEYRLLPLKMLILINAGDSPRVLAHKLKTYSTLCFDKMVRMSSRFIACIQPLMFLIVGAVIVGTYLSMLLPMYRSIKGVD